MTLLAGQVQCRTAAGGGPPVDVDAIGTPRCSGPPFCWVGGPRCSSPCWLTQGRHNSGVTGQARLVQRCLAIAVDLWDRYSKDRNVGYCQCLCNTRSIFAAIFPRLLPRTVITGIRTSSWGLPSCPACQVTNAYLVDQDAFGTDKHPGGSEGARLGR